MSTVGHQTKRALTLVDLPNSSSSFRTSSSPSASLLRLLVSHVGSSSSRNGECPLVIEKEEKRGWILLVSRTWETQVRIAPWRRGRLSSSGLGGPQESDRRCQRSGDAVIDAEPSCRMTKWRCLLHHRPRARKRERDDAAAHANMRQTQKPSWPINA